jgi:hypothetical protein
MSSAILSGEHRNTLKAMRSSNLPRPICFGSLGSVSGYRYQRTTPERVSPHSQDLWGDVLRPWTSAFRGWEARPRRSNRRARYESPHPFNYPRLLGRLAPRSSHYHSLPFESLGQNVCPLSPPERRQRPCLGLSAHSRHCTTLCQREGCEDTRHCMLIAIDSMLHSYLHGN